MDSSTIAIDPNLKEAEGTTHTTPAALRDAKRSGRAKGKAATKVKAMVAVDNGSGSYVLVPSDLANGDAGFYHDDASTPAIDPASKVKRPRGRPRKQRDGDGAADADGSAPQPKKRKPRKKAVQDDNDDDGDPDARPQKRVKTPVEIEVEIPAVTVDAVDPVDPGDQELPESGPLIKREQSILDGVMKDYREARLMEQREVNEMIQSTSRAQSDEVKELWTLLYDALPQRPHVSVMRAARRRYHNYPVRGKWTPDDDQLLKEANARFPGKWVNIGSMLGRMPEDCRDRWRNYLSCGDERKTDDWSEKEEAELQKAVEECIAAARQEAKDRAKAQGHAFRELDWESYVNFNIVSEKMKHTRSRLQCYTHWKVMQKRDGIEVADRTAAKKSVSKNPTRQGRALAKYDRMSPVDKFVILRQIAESEAQEENDINWKAINRHDIGGKWSTRERKEAFAKMKELVPPQDTLRATIETLCEYLMNNHTDDFALRDAANGDGLDAVAAKVLLQQEIDASPEATKARGRGRQYVPAEQANDAADGLRQLYGNDGSNRGLVIEETPEQDIQDLNVARALQGIAQLSQERGELR